MEPSALNVQKAKTAGISLRTLITIETYVPDVYTLLKKHPNTTGLCVDIGMGTRSASSRHLMVKSKDVTVRRTVATMLHHEVTR